MTLTKDDLRQLPRLLEDDPELQLEVARAFLNEATVTHLMRQDPQLREAFYRAVMTERLLQLPDKVEQLDQFVRQHASQTDARLQNVERDVSEMKQAQAVMQADLEQVKQTQAVMQADLEQVKQAQAVMQADLEQVKQTQAVMQADLEQVKQTQAVMQADLEQVKQTQSTMQATLNRVEQEVHGLNEWRRGEEGRRDGERYERRIVSSALALFGSGEGGSPERDFNVRRRLEETLLRGGVDLLQEDEADYPMLADIIWWKGDHFALAEVSLKVNGEDVQRAKRRAEVLRKAGVEVLPVVVGSEWAHPETRELAEREGVAWRVGKEYSPALIEYRRLLVE